MYIRQTQSGYERFNISRNLAGTGIDKNNLAASGISEIPDPARPNDRYYDVNELNQAATPEGPWIISTPKELAGLKETALTQIKQTRQATLDLFTKSAGVSAVYSENLLAAQRLQASDTTPMRSGETPDAYLTAMGSKLGQTSTEFAIYILQENAAAAVKAEAVERIYLDYAYAKINVATFESIQTLVSEYQAEIAAVLA